jgi:hypothetical protein
VFQPALNLNYASRLPSLSHEGKGVKAAEIGTLLLCGIVSAIVVCGFQLRIRIPGHVILGAVLPMSLGMALVPRRLTGALMPISAAGTAAIMYLCGGNVRAAAIVSLVALGPFWDLAALGTAHGWRLYVRFVLAGAIANLIAFAARWSTAMLGWEPQGSRRVLTFWPSALASFILCGAVAGLISAIVWFRWRANDDLRRA